MTTFNLPNRSSFTAGGLILLANTLVLFAPSLLPARVIGAALLVCFLPGWFLTAAMFPRASDLESNVRIALAGGASLALSVELLWLLTLLGVPIQLPTLLGALDVLIAALALAAIVNARVTALPPRPVTSDRWRFALIVGAGCLMIALGTLNLPYAEFSGDEQKVTDAALDLLTGNPAILYTTLKGPAQVLLTVAFVQLTDSFSEGAERTPFMLASIIALAGALCLTPRQWRLRWVLLVGLFWLANNLTFLRTYFVQYQPYVLALAHTALLCALRATDLARQGDSLSARQHWLMSAFLFGAGLMGHYDMLFMAPVLGYLYFFASTRKPPVMKRARAFAPILALLVALLSAPFYISMTARPGGLVSLLEYSDRRVGLQDAPFNHLPDFAADIASSYQLQSATLLLASVTIGAAFALVRALRDHAQPRLAWFVWGIAGLATLTAVWQPDWWSISGRSAAIVPFSLFSTLTLHLVRDFHWKALWQWLLTVFFFSGFLMLQPIDHYFIGLLPLVLIGVKGVRITTLVLQRCVRVRFRPLARRSVNALATVLALAGFALTVMGSNPALGAVLNIASPRAFGWRAVAAMYASGELRGEYDSNESPRVPQFYLLHRWSPPRADPTYFFLSGIQKSFDNKAVPADLEQTHHLIKSVTVAGETQMRIYQRIGYIGTTPETRYSETLQGTWESLASLRVIRAMKRDGRDDSAFYQLAHAVQAAGREGDAIAFSGIGSRFVFSQYYSGNLPYVGSASQATALYRRVWGVFWSGSDEIERELALHAYAAGAQWFGNIRMRLYATSPDLKTLARGDRFGTLATLTEAAALPLSLRPGAFLPVRLVWRAARADSKSYKLFVHVTGDGGAPMAQADDEPMAGLAPTTQWKPGEMIETRVGILLPTDIRAGRYSVTVGLYDPNTSERIAVLAADGMRYTNDAVPLGEITIASD